MGDQEVFSDHDEKKNSEHADRVSGAFGSLEKKLGERFTKEEQRVLGIREAMLRRDKAQLERHLTDAKTESSWLYEELMKHPEISAIMRELSIMGF
jgi:predicted  nucleic acid-binding Zn-ribbon protein